MGRGALLHLLVRPLTYVLAAIVVPIAALLLFKVGPLGSTAAIGVSSFACAWVGVFCGGGIREAARCSFAWTLPGYRRALIGEFVICGVAVSGLAALVGALVTPGLYPALVAIAAGFAAFSIGAVLLVPEWSLLFTVAYVAIVAVFASQRLVAGTLLDAPLATIAVALAVSILALWAGFSTRSFRWLALTGPRPDGRFIWHEWPTIPWWPRLRIRFFPAWPAPARARYVGTSVLRAVAANYRAMAPIAWLASPVIFVLCVAAVGPNALNVVRIKPLPGFWAIVVYVWWMSSLSSRRSPNTTLLPWSRRQHLAFKHARDLGDVLIFLMTMVAAAVAAGDWEVLLGAMWRGIAVMAIFFPGFQRLSSSPTGGPQANRGVAALLGAALLVVFVVALNFVVTGLPAFVSSGVAQAFLLGLLVVASQMLNWRSLKRYFAGRDLVGGTLY